MEKKIKLYDKEFSTLFDEDLKMEWRKLRIKLLELDKKEDSHKEYRRLKIYYLKKYLSIIKKEQNREELKEFVNEVPYNDYKAYKRFYLTILELFDVDSYTLDYEIEKYKLR